MIALREMVGGNYENLVGLKENAVKAVVLKEAHFKEGISRVKPSPTIKSRDYLEWNDKFGSN